MTRIRKRGDKVKTTIYVDRDIWKAMLEKCKAEKIVVSSFLEDAMDKYLNGSGFKSADMTIEELHAEIDLEAKNNDLDD
jgi:hypothetical protein